MTDDANESVNTESRARVLCPPFSSATGRVRLRICGGFISPVSSPPPSPHHHPGVYTPQWLRTNRKQNFFGGVSAAPPLRRNIYVTRGWRVGLATPRPGSWGGAPFPPPPPQRLPPTVVTHGGRTDRKHDLVGGCQRMPPAGGWRTAKSVRTAQSIV